MSFNRYYQSELTTLREMGRDFAERNPDLAPFFNTQGRDPDVERILEGFAFLTGRLRQKLDDELPEITHALFNLLWPNYLRQIPSCSVVQFTPAGNIAKPVNIPAGTQLDSAPVEGTPCTFSTTYNTEVLPVRLAGQKIFTQDGQAVLLLRFKTFELPLENIDIKKLRLFLDGDKSTALTIYFYLLKKVREIRVSIPGKNSEKVIATLGADSIQQVGFADDEALLPYPPNAFPGYRILQEYFCFPEKFMFLDILNLDRALNKERFGESEAPNEFSLQFLLEDLPDNFESFRPNNFKLFCSPVINLFPKSASPLTLDSKQNEYRIVPDPRYPYHFSTYAVNRVESWEHASRGEKEYRPFESFERPGSGTGGYYRLRVKPSVKDQAIETYISIIQNNSGTKKRLHETVSLELTCTNRLLAKELKVGDIFVPTDNSPESMLFSNIIPVTPPYMPPLDGDMLWRLLSNMSLNYIPLTNINALKSILSAYDFSAIHDSVKGKVLKNTMAGMIGVEYRETDRIYRGLPLRGGITHLRLDKNSFSCEGGMYLFASVLNEFLVMYATINSFHQLMVTEHSSGEEYIWQTRLGGQLI